MISQKRHLDTLYIAYTESLFLPFNNRGKRGSNACCGISRVSVVDDHGYYIGPMLVAERTASVL